jgi:hypothetical protein
LISARCARRIGDVTSRADQLAKELAGDAPWAEVLRVARQIIAETGDLPEGLWWEMGYRQTGNPSQGEAWRALAALRPFGAPPYKGGWQ